MIKKLILGVFVFIVLTVVGGTLYLNMIDWNEHKAVIARQFSEATGKNVSFNGSVSFNLFPTPSLEASDIVVYNTDKNSQRVILSKIQKLVASLSVNSLLKGKINVENMTVVNPEIYIEAYEDGGINWQSSGGNSKDFAINNVEVSFGSVILDNAKLHLIDKQYEIDTVVSSINAEVIAESLFGPYRIEGSYVKDGTPGGFALDLGKFSESFATSINAVISHPESESYVRFDGTVLLKNDAVNGNITIESKNPVNFINSSFSKVKIDEKYESPLAMSLAVKSDKSQIALSDIVIKYDGNAGAGNILIPRQETKIGESGMERRRIDVAFNFAEMNLEPAIMLFQDFLKKYDGADYIPEYGFDVIADVKAVKTTYKNQVIRDFELSVDFVDNVLSVQNLAMQLPFDGLIKTKGEIYAKEKVLTYNFDIDASTPDLSKTSQWLGYPLVAPNKNVYRRASGKTTLAGTLQTIKVAPFVLNIDKTSVNGKLAMIRGENNKYFAIADVDNLNFDNYIADMPVEVAEGDLSAQAAYRFAQLKALKDLDLQFKVSLTSGIWSKIPFEKLAVEAVLKDGLLKISDLSVGSVASAQIAMRGEISGFGSDLAFKNLKYGIDIKNNADFAERMRINPPAINLRNLVQLNSKGIVTGGLKRMAIKANSKLGYIDSTFSGEITNGPKGLSWGGTLDLRCDDFVKMLNDFSVAYHPEYPLGLLKFAGEVRNNGDTVLLRNFNADIGSNHFSGDVVYARQNDRNSVKANLKANKFEIERFFYNTNGKGEVNVFRGKADKVPFLAKPVLSKNRIGYEWSKDWDIDGKFNVGTLSFKNTILKNAMWSMNLAEQVLKVSQFTADSGEGVVNADVELNIPEQNKLSGKVSVKNIKVNKDEWSGLTYGLLNGTAEGELTFDTNATSAEAILLQLSGKGRLKVAKPTVKGWNLEVLEEDLAKRNLADGLKALAQQNLSSGETVFDNMSAEFTLENGAFNLRKAIFDNQSYNIEASANGNLSEWTADSSFSVLFKKLPKVAAFNFTLNGNINAPSLDVDVSPITDVFEANLAKAQADAKAARDATIKKYRDLLDEQMARAEKFQQRLQRSLKPDYEEASVLAKDEKMKRYYADINKLIIKANQQIAEVIGKRNMVDIDDEVINNLTAQNNAIEETLSDIVRDMTSTHAQDVRLRIATPAQRIAEQREQARKIPNMILDMNGKFSERLAAINTTYLLDKDVRVQQIQKNISKLQAYIDEKCDQVANDNIVARGITDIEVLEKYAADFEKYNQMIDEKMSEIYDYINDYQDYVQPKVEAEEKAYQQKLYDEAVRQKISENTGSIATAGGKKVMLERNWDEIKRSEEAIRQQREGVLNFDNK